jgi:hypothetical protein
MIRVTTSEIISKRRAHDDTNCRNESAATYRVTSSNAKITHKHASIAPGIKMGGGTYEGWMISGTILATTW